MSEPWKEEDSAFVDSFFLPGGILDPEDEEDIGILSTLPTGQRIPSNPWGNQKFQSATSSPGSYLHAVKQYETEPPSPNTFLGRTVEESDSRVNSPLRTIVRPPPGYDGYVNGLGSTPPVPNAVSPVRPNHSDLLSANHMKHGSAIQCNGLPCQQNGLMSSPKQSSMMYGLSQTYSPSTQQLDPVNKYTATGRSLSVPTLANEFNFKQQAMRSSKSDKVAKPKLPSSHPVNDTSTLSPLKTEAVSTSKHLVQNPFNSSVKEVASKQLSEEDSKEQVPERSSIASTSVGTSMDTSSHMTPFCDGKEECLEHILQHTDSGAASKDNEFVGECSESEHIDDIHSPQDTSDSRTPPVVSENEISKSGDKTNGQTHADTVVHHVSVIDHDTGRGSGFQETSSTTSQNSVLQGILRPFSLVFRMVTLLLLDLPRKGVNAVTCLISATYVWSLSTAQRMRGEVVSVAKSTAHFISTGMQQSAETAKSGALLLAHSLSMAPSFAVVMSKASLIQALEEPSSAFCYTVFYFLPSWCSSLAQYVDVPHWSAHFIITIAIYLVSHPVKPGILHRGEFPVSEVMGALFRNGNLSDQVFIDKFERRAAVRKRNERICSKCLRILRCCLPIFCLIDGFSYDGATIIGDSGASRLTTAFMMSLVRRNLAFSPIGWVSWAIQVLVANYLNVWILRDTMVLLLGLSSFRLIRYFDQKRLKKKRKRR